MSMFKKAAAFLTAVGIVASCTACGYNTRTALTVEGIEVPAGVYIYYANSAYNQALSKLKEENADLDTTDTQAVKGMTLEGKDILTWVQDEATKQCTQYAVLEKKFTDLGLSIDEDAKSNISMMKTYYWDSSKDRMEKNGISEASFDKVLTSSYKSDEIYKYYYAVGGQEGVTDDDVYNYYKDNNMRVEFLTVSLKDGEGNLLKSDGKKEMMTMLEGYRDRIEEALENGGVKAAQEEMAEVRKEYQAYQDSLTADKSDAEGTTEATTEDETIEETAAETETTEKKSDEETTEKKSDEETTEKKSDEETTEKKSDEETTEKKSDEKTTEAATEKVDETKKDNLKAPKSDEETTAAATASEEDTTEQKSDEKTTEKKSDEKTTEKKSDEETTEKKSDEETTEAATEEETDGDEVTAAEDVDSDDLAETVEESNPYANETIISIVHEEDYDNKDDIYYNPTEQVYKKLLGIEAKDYGKPYIVEEDENYYLVMRYDIEDRMVANDLWTDSTKENTVYSMHNKDFQNMVDGWVATAMVIRNDAAYTRFNPFKFDFN